MLKTKTTLYKLRGKCQLKKGVLASFDEWGPISLTGNNVGGIVPCRGVARIYETGGQSDVRARKFFYTPPFLMNHALYRKQMY